VIRYVLAALACYRLSQLVALDDGPFFVFQRLRDWSERISIGKSGDHLYASLRELLMCPYCLGVWFAAVTLALSTTPWGQIINAWLGIAGAQALLEGFNNVER